MARQSLVRGARLRVRVRLRNGSTVSGSAPACVNVWDFREDARAVRRGHDAMKHAYGDQTVLALRDQHAAQVIEDLFRTKLPQAVQMAERALALEAGATFEMQPLYLREL